MTSQASGRNPPATAGERRRARAVARQLAREYADAGARAVVFAGSWVRGDAHRASDIDLWVLGHRRGTEVRWRNGFTVCANHTSVLAERRSLRNPGRLGGSVPGWRIAVPLFDPDGVAARLKAEAQGFRWDGVAPRCDRWVAENVVGWAEEVVKLARAIELGQLETAAVQRNLLANGLASVLAIHRRQLWDSENGLWERIGAAVGGPWQRAQRRALGTVRTGPRASCRAAIDLYYHTVTATWSLLSDEERSIAGHACAVAGRGLALGGAG